MWHDDRRQILSVAVHRHSKIPGYLRAIGSREHDRLHGCERHVCQIRADGQHFGELSTLLVEEVEGAWLGVAPGKHQQLAFVGAGVDEADERLLGQCLRQCLR